MISENPTFQLPSSLQDFAKQINLPHSKSTFPQAEQHKEFHGGITAISLLHQSTSFVQVKMVAHVCLFFLQSSYQLSFIALGR